MSRPSRILLAAALLAALLATPAAIAAAPKKGGSYRGTLAAPRTSIAVTFKVSASGRKVSALKISNMPLYCSGGGPAVPITFKPASIAKGKFKSTAKQTISAGPSKGQTGATLSITGKFASHGKQSGKLTIKYPNAPACGGTSTYTTHA
jgi:hypothetical protein